MIKAILLILLPVHSWERIAQSARGFWFVFFLHLLPTVALSVAGEMYGRNYFLERYPTADSQLLAPELVIRYGAAQFVGSLLMVFISALLVRMLADTFHNRSTYSQCFRVVAYAMSPFFLARLADTIPGMLPWVTFAIGMVLAISTLYSGIPRVMRPDPPHAFGLYLVSAVMLAMVGGLIRFVTLLVLDGKIVIP